MIIEIELMLSPSLTPEQHQDLINLVERLNEKLRAAGSGSAEQAFGIGCGIGILPSLVIISLLLIFGVIDLILAAILVVVAALALAGVSTLLALKARTNAMRRIYQRDIEVEILQYLRIAELSRPQFDTLAYQILPEGAPLQGFLTPEFDSEDQAFQKIEKQE